MDKIKINFVDGPPPFKVRELPIEYALDDDTSNERLVFKDGYEGHETEIHKPDAEGIGISAIEYKKL